MCGITSIRLRIYTYFIFIEATTIVTVIFPPQHMSSVCALCCPCFGFPHYNMYFLQSVIDKLNSHFYVALISHFPNFDLYSPPLHFSSILCCTGKIHCSYFNHNTVVSQVSAHGRLNIHCDFGPDGCLPGIIISIRLYRSCYIDPLK